MSNLKITKDIIKDGIKVEQKKYGDTFDPWYGYNTVEFTHEDIDWLLQGKPLYFTDEEYSFLIYVKE